MAVVTAQATRCVWFGGKRGIHLRPAAEIAAVASRFPCAITIRCGEKTANAKSVLDLLLLAAEEGAELTIEAGGPESDAALDALGEVLARRG
jgi:phosphotransferase system HPr (HPr) family protein